GANDPFSQLEAISFDIGGDAGGCKQKASSGEDERSQGPGGANRPDYRQRRFDTGTQQTGGGGFGGIVVSVGGGGGGGGGGYMGQNAANQAIQNAFGPQGGGQAQPKQDGRADEEVPILISTQRMLINGANAGLASTWNILCAFQMAYLYYLFC